MTSITGGSAGDTSYWYDQSSRLVHATIPAPGHTQDFVYDGFGNMTSMTTDSESHALATTTATNRLSANVYDVVGNVTTDELAYQYVYDAFNMITDKRGGTEIDVYETSDERLGALRAGKRTWTLRAARDKVLREYQSADASVGAAALWLGDYI